MKINDLRQEIEFEMRRVPRRGGQCQYIPIKNMPVGTEIWFDATTIPTPGSLEPRYTPDPEGWVRLVQSP
jgi:hypothetical protein